MRRVLGLRPNIINDIPNIVNIDNDIANVADISNIIIDIDNISNSMYSVSNDIKFTVKPNDRNIQTQQAAEWRSGLRAELTTQKPGVQDRRFSCICDPPHHATTACTLVPGGFWEGVDRKEAAAQLRSVACFQVSGKTLPAASATVHEGPPDGDCFFAAVGQTVLALRYNAHGTSNTCPVGPAYRKMFLRFLADDLRAETKYDGVQTSTVIRSCSGLSVNQYLLRMAAPSPGDQATWGGYLEAAILAAHLKIRIAFHEAVQEGYLFICDAPDLLGKHRPVGPQKAHPERGQPKPPPGPCGGAGAHQVHDARCHRQGPWSAQAMVAPSRPVEDPPLEVGYKGFPFIRDFPL